VLSLPTAYDLQSRRTFLARSSLGIGSLALANLLNPTILKGQEEALPLTHERWPGAVHPLNFAPRAKRVIFLYMAGGPSQLESLDFKPELTKRDGQAVPESLTGGQPSALLQGQSLVCMGPRAKFHKFGHSGQEVSLLFPHTAGIADQLCIVRSMQTDQINHDPAHTLMNTGTSISGRPSMGAWVSYGLGSETDNLPGFVVLTSSGGRAPQPLSSRQWHSGFLPGNFQGVEFQSGGDPVHYVRCPPGVDLPRQRGLVSAIQSLNRVRSQSIDDPEVATRISQYELAFRMQASVPELMDVSREPQHILDMYGTDGTDGTFGANCLLARRLAERGVRFIQLYHSGWDHHEDLTKFMDQCAGLVDKASAALIVDLKQRGMLDETLVVWGGEFGRTPMAQPPQILGLGDSLGRDHHIRAFSMWLAGGGIKPGITYGETDDFGYNVANNPVHVNDLHATILQQLGIDHKRLTYRFQGRDFRLTDVGGRVVSGILS
jgi:hypothetical protein